MILFLGLCPNVSHSQETRSDDYQLDFDMIVNEAEYTQSDNYQVQGHSTDIETVITSDNFQIVPPYLPVCGNQIIETGEECDGADFGGLTCQDYGYLNGDLTCSLCRIDSSTCNDYDPGGSGSVLPYCGDGKINRASEQCDDGNRSNGDGCSKNCQIEDGAVLPAHTEPETPTDDKPTPEEQTENELPSESTESEVLHPAAEEEIETKPIPVYNHAEAFHPAPEETPNHLKTTDQTPIISMQIEPKQEYELKIYDENGEEVKFLDGNGEEQKLEIKTNESGNFVYAIPEELDYGYYHFEVSNIEEKYEMGMEVIDEEYNELALEKVNNNPAENNYVQEIQIVKEERNYVEGYAEKNAQVIIYLGNRQEKVELTPDENNFFHYEIPIDENQVYVLQVYEDKVISKNLSYALITPEETSWWWLILILLVVGYVIYKEKQKQK